MERVIICFSRMFLLSSTVCTTGTWRSPSPGLRCPVPLTQYVNSCRFRILLEQWTRCYSGPRLPVSQFWKVSSVIVPTPKDFHSPDHCSTYRPRLVRLVSPTNASVHDLLLIDSPKFHIVLDFAVNVEAYHLTIRGANLGSYDGIDAIGENYWIHDNEVTNRDECVSVKSPSNHALVENLICNQAGSGISIGSLNSSAEISNIVS